MPVYSDDGKVIDPSEIITPEKCFKCKQYTPRELENDGPPEMTEEWENLLLCTLVRAGYKEGDEFECHAYKYNSRWKSIIN